jgi:hypothetical protein
MKLREIVNKVSVYYNTDIKLAAEIVSVEEAVSSANEILDTLDEIKKELEKLKTVYDGLLVNFEKRLEHLEIEKRLENYWPN